MCQYANWGIEKMNWIINKLFIGHWYIICIGILFSAANWHIGILAYFIIGTLFFVISLQPMKYYLYILLFLIGTAASAHAQGRSGSRGGRGGFSLSNLSSSNKEIPDSLLQTDSAALKSKRIIGYRLTPDRKSVV